MSKLDRQRQIDYIFTEVRQQIAVARQKIEICQPDILYLKHAIDRFEHLLNELEKERQESRSQARLATLYQVSRLLGSSLDIQTVLEQVMDAVVWLTDAERGFVMLVNENDDLEFLVARNLDEKTYAGDEFAISHTITWHVVQKGEAILTTNALEDPRFAEQESIQIYNLRSILAAPLRVRGESIGAIYVDNRAREGLFGKDDLELLETLAQQAAIAVENARLFTRLAQAKEHLAAIVNNSPDAIILLNMDGNIKETNPAFDSLFGCAEDSLSAAPADLVCSDDLAALRRAFSKVAEEGKMQRLEATARRVDGTAFDADVALAPVKKEDIVTNIVCSVRDISGLKEASRMKDAFIGNASHELRTPIASLKLYHDLLQRNPSKQNVYIERLKRETERLHRLVEDVLYLSRLDQQKMPLNITEVDFNALVQQYTTDRAVLAKEKNLTLICDLSPSLPVGPADKALMGRVLSILLTNGLNYTPAGGSVTVSTQTRQFDNRQWVGFQVHDTGPGIPEKEQTHLFERFFRGEAAREANLPGTGLGLSIAHEIVERHNGHICVESTLGEKTIFSVWVPA